MKYSKLAQFSAPHTVAGQEMLNNASGQAQAQGQALSPRPSGPAMHVQNVDPTWVCKSMLTDRLGKCQLLCTHSSKRIPLDGA